MKNSIANTKGEIDLLVNESKYVSIDSFEPWQQEEFIDMPCNASLIKENTVRADNSLITVEDLITNWVENLTPAEIKKIRYQKSLFGVKFPIEWMKFWRGVLKSPELRDEDFSTQNGKAIGTFQHHWYLWVIDCFDRYLSPMEKEMIDMCDKGFSYKEIGGKMMKKYKQDFFSPKKKNTKTSYEQTVSRYFYDKIPTKLACSELLNMFYAIHGNKK